MTLQITASEREFIGKAASNKTRRNGNLPIVVYIKNGDNLHLEVDAHAFGKIFEKKNFISGAIDLSVGKKTYKVLPKSFTCHRVKGTLQHVDFINITDSKEISALIPIEYTGFQASPGAKQDGYLNKIKRRIMLQVPSSAIPSQLSYDCSAMSVGDKITNDQLTLPAGCSLLKDKKIIIATILGKGGKKDEAETDGSSAEDEETAEESKE